MGRRVAAGLGVRVDTTHATTDDAAHNPDTPVPMVATRNVLPSVEAAAAASATASEAGRWG